MGDDGGGFGGGFSDSGGGGGFSSGGDGGDGGGFSGGDTWGGGDTGGGGDGGDGDGGGAFAPSGGAFSGGGTFSGGGGDPASGGYSDGSGGPTEGGGFGGGFYDRQEAEAAAERARESSWLPTVGAGVGGFFLGRATAGGPGWGWGSGWGWGGPSYSTVYSRGQPGWGGPGYYPQPQPQPYGVAPPPPSVYSPIPTAQPGYPARGGGYPELTFQQTGRPGSRRPVTFWMNVIVIVVALWLYFVTFASQVVELHVRDQRLFRANSWFTTSLQVQEYQGWWPNPPPKHFSPHVYAFFTSDPPRTTDEFTTGKPGVVVQGNGFQAWRLWLNAGSSVTLSYALAPPQRLSFVVLRGNGMMARWKNDPVGTQKEAETHGFLAGKGSLSFNSRKDDEYYFAFGNFVPRAVTGDIFFHVRSVVYDTQQAADTCYVSRDKSCKLDVPFGQHRSIVVGAVDQDSRATLQTTNGSLPSKAVNAAPASSSTSTSQAIIPASAASAVGRRALAAGATATATAAATTAAGAAEAASAAVASGGVRAATPGGAAAAAVDTSAASAGSSDDVWSLRVSYGTRWLAYVILVASVWLVSAAFRLGAYMLRARRSFDDSYGVQAAPSSSSQPSSTPGGQPPAYASLSGAPQSASVAGAAAAAGAGGTAEKEAAAAGPAAIHRKVPIPDSWISSHDPEVGSGDHEHPTVPSAPPAPLAGGEGASVCAHDATCVVCMEKPRDAVVLDCGHRATCLDCGRMLQASKSPQCPICRRDIRQVTKVFDA